MDKPDMGCRDRCGIARGHRLDLDGVVDQLWKGNGDLKSTMAGLTKGVKLVKVTIGNLPGNVFKNWGLIVQQGASLSSSERHAFGNVLA